MSILAHSYGGLISREYLHRSPLERAGDPKIDKVVMLDTPNCGSHLADIGVIRDITILIGWDDAAAASCSTYFVQNVFNVRYRDPIAPVSFYSFGGTGTSGLRWYERWITWPLLYSWPTGTPNPNDGFVTVASAHGWRWINPARVGATIVWSAQRQVGGTDFTTSDEHSAATSNPNTLAEVRNILLGGRRSLAYAPQTRQPIDGGDVPVGFALVSTTNGTLQAGSASLVSLPIDDCEQATFSLAHDLGSVGFTLTLPDGSTIDSATTNIAVHYGVAANESGVNEFFGIDNPPVGLWTIRLQAATNLPNGIGWSLVAGEQSDLTIVPITEYFQVAGNLAVSAMLAKSTQAVGGAVLSATIQRPDGTKDQLPLYDDGAHGDGAAYDGVYANGYGFLINAGIYSVRYSATGTNSQGHAFARIEAGSFQIAPQTAWLAGTYSDQGVDLGPPPGLEEVAVNVGVQVATDGVYSVSAVLTDAAGNELASAAAAPTALAAGTTNLTLHFDADGLRRGTNDGPYLLTSLVLWDDSSGLSLRADYATNAHITAAYQRTNFSDRLPPQAVSDLSAGSIGSQSVVLRWTAPDNEGKAAAYSIRYRKGGLWPGVWDTATAVASPPAPALPGTPQTLTIGGLDIGNTYYFGLKSTDQAGNKSELSNVQMVRLFSAITSTKMLTNGEFQCSFAGEAGRSYIVQVSTNLTQWLPLSTNTIGFTNNSFVFADSQAASYRQRFYRCAQGP